MSAREVAERLRLRRVTAEVQTTEGVLYVRGLNGRERAQYFEWLSGDGATGKVLMSDHRLLALALCDEKGGPLFDDEKAGLEVIQEWTHEDVSAAAKRALALSGMGKSSEDDAAKK